MSHHRKTCKCGTELIRNICWSCGGFFDTTDGRFYSGDLTTKKIHSAKRVVHKKTEVKR